MAKSGVKFPPHLLGLEFLDDEAIKRLFERMEASGGGDDSGKAPELSRVGLVTSSSYLRTAVHSAFAGSPSTVIDIRNDTLSNEDNLREVVSTAPLLDVLFVEFNRHTLAENLASRMVVPVVNLASSEAVPCQILADYCTISRSAQGSFELLYVGRADAYCHTWMRAAASLGFKLAVVPPSGSEPDGILLSSLLDRGAAIEIYRSSEEVPETDFVCLGRGCEAILGTGHQILEPTGVKKILVPEPPWHSRTKLLGGMGGNVLYERQMMDLSRLLESVGCLLTNGLD